MVALFSVTVFKLLQNGLRFVHEFPLVEMRPCGNHHGEQYPRHGCMNSGAEKGQPEHSRQAGILGFLRFRLPAFFVATMTPSDTKGEKNSDGEDHKPVYLDMVMKLQTVHETHNNTDDKRNWKADCEQKKALFHIHDGSSARECPRNRHDLIPLHKRKQCLNRSITTSGDFV